MDHVEVALPKQGGEGAQGSIIPPDVYFASEARDGDDFQSTLLGLGEEIILGARLGTGDEYRLETSPGQSRHAFDGDALGAPPDQPRDDDTHADSFPGRRGLGRAVLGAVIEGVQFGSSGDEVEGGSPFSAFGRIRPGLNSATPRSSMRNGEEWPG